MAGGLEDVAVIVGLVPMLAALLTVAGDDGDCVVVEVELDGCCVVLGADCANCAPLVNDIVIDTVAHFRFPALSVALAVIV